MCYISRLLLRVRPAYSISGNRFKWFCFAFIMYVYWIISRILPTYLYYYDQCKLGCSKLSEEILYSRYKTYANDFVLICVKFKMIENITPHQIERMCFERWSLWNYSLHRVIIFYFCHLHWTAGCVSMFWTKGKILKFHQKCWKQSKTSKPNRNVSVKLVYAYRVLT